MAPEVQDSKKCTKTAKMKNCALSQWNRWGRTKFHLDHSSPLKKQWFALCQVPPSNGENFVKSKSW
jgi:hypothetical protein